MNTYNGEFLSRDDLTKLGVVTAGPDVRVHKSVVIINPEALALGDHIRVDPFCILSATGGIRIGNYVHISAHATLIGEGGIEVGDFANISHGAKIFSAADKGRGYLVGAMVPTETRQVTRAPVRLMNHAAVCAGAVIMPGVTLEEGSVAGALSYIRKDLPAWTIWFGNPARYLRRRERDDVLRRAEGIARQDSAERGTADPGSPWRN